MQSLNSFSIQWLSPGYLFKEIQGLGVKSIILASGTLAPLNSLEHELKTKFNVKLENDHVISKDRVLLATLSKGVNQRNFMFTYKNKENIEMIDELGETIEEILNHVPDGALIFFPSYSTMSMVLKIWKSNSIFNRINKLKEIFIEPQG